MSTPTFSDQSGYPLQLAARGTGAFTCGGLMDELAICERAVSARETADHYAMGSP